MTVTIHQVTADGAGPYLRLRPNFERWHNLTNLTVTSNVPGVNGLSQGKTQDFNVTVVMPANLACTGASIGNVCTVRCRNNSVAGPFGGSFAVQQTDVTRTANSAETITTAQTLAGITKQIAENQIGLPMAIEANANAGSGEAFQGLAAVKALLGISVTSVASPVQTLAVENVDAAEAAAASATATAKAGKAGKVAANTASATAAAATAKASAATKGGKNTNRRDTLRWAKRIVDGESA